MSEVCGKKVQLRLFGDSAVPADRPAAPKPDATWATERLVQMVIWALAEAGVLARKTTAAVLLAGCALWFLRERLTPARKWCSFQRENNLPRTSVWEAIELYVRAKEAGLTDEQVCEMPWPEAKDFFGIGKDKNDAEAGCPVEAEPVEDTASNAEPVAVAAVAAEAAPAGQVAKEVKKSDQPPLSPCEIDAATTFIKAVGGWQRAIAVLQLVQAIVGG